MQPYYWTDYNGFNLFLTEEGIKLFEAKFRKILDSLDRVESIESVVKDLRKLDSRRMKDLENVYDAEPLWGDDLVIKISDLSDKYDKYNEPFAQFDAHYRLQNREIYGNITAPKAHLVMEGILVRDKIPQEWLDFVYSKQVAEWIKFRKPFVESLVKLIKEGYMDGSQQALLGNWYVNPSEYQMVGQDTTYGLLEPTVIHPDEFYYVWNFDVNKVVPRLSGKIPFTKNLNAIFDSKEKNWIELPDNILEIRNKNLRRITPKRYDPA